ncbi:unnamed protein product [Amoebophrya sp. A120]|nr:unnamed protein product [Amoebophrya sp. A120]|eukprot:GSA120T00000570001.1
MDFVTSASSIPSSAEVTSQFRRRDFEVTDFIGKVATQGNDFIGTLANVLDESLTGIQSNLHAEVVLCHDRLLDNTFNLELLDKELSEVRENVSVLKASMQEVRSHCLVPFRDLRRKTALLNRAQRVNVLLRRYLRFEFDLKKLRAHVDPGSGGLTKEYAKAARTIYELENALLEDGLEKLSVLQRDIHFIREVGQQIRGRAKEDLWRGLKEMNLLVLEQATQAFYNLHCLSEELELLASDLARKLDELLKPLGTRFSGSITVAALLDNFFAAGTAVCSQIAFLDNFLRNRTDPITHAKFSDCFLLYNGKNAETNTVTTAALSSSSTGTTAAPGTTSTSILRPTSFLEVFFHLFFSEYFAPKLRQSLHQATIAKEFPLVSKKLEASFLDVLQEQGATGSVIFQLKKQLFALPEVENLHNQYIQTVLTRVTEPVELMLPEAVLNSAMDAVAQANAGMTPQPHLLQDPLPTLADVKRYVQILAEALKTAEQGLQFVYLSVVNNVRTSVLLFVSRLELLTDANGMMVVTNFQANPTGNEFTFTNSHQRNCRLFQLLSAFDASLREMCLGQNLPPQLWQHLRTTCRSFVECFFQTVRIKFSQEYYAKWRQELLNTGGAVAPDVAALPSPSLQEFVTYAHSVQKTYLAAYNTQLLQSLAVQFAGDLVRVALLRLFLGTFYDDGKVVAFYNNSSSTGATSTSGAVVEQIVQQPNGGTSTHTLSDEAAARQQAVALVPGIATDIQNACLSTDAGRKRLCRDLELLERGVLALAGVTSGQPFFEQHILALTQKVVAREVPKATLLEHVAADVVWSKALNEFLV